MLGLFFEVQIKDGGVDQYLDLAASLRPKLDAMGGCLFIDRFRSLSRENLILSYQIWQDEGALTAWRVDPVHHKVQETGRDEVFDDYRIRVSQVLHEQRPDGAVWKPERLPSYNDPARRAPTYVVASESKNADLPVKPGWSGDSFASVYRDGVFAHLIDVPDLDKALAFGESLFADPTTEYFRVFEVTRDYGMFERAEAPQYYPPVERD